MTAGALSSSSSLRSQRGLSVTSEAEELDLLESPSDLICPITHELFLEPAINSVGQVYERAAIEKALATKLVDPISNLPLPTAALTTVWPMKSKAAAYRERAVRGCIAQVCRPDCRTPIRYLRRAAELSAGALAGVPSRSPIMGVVGLTPEVVDYVLTHPSSIYDFQALGRFAASLVACGQRDRAAGLYTQLLQLGGDSQQQVEALQGLLECWGLGAPEGEEEPDEHQLVEQLAALACGEGPDGGYRPARFVGVLLAAGLPEELVLRFCEHILGSPSSGGAGSWAGGAGGARGVGGGAVLATSSSGRMGRSSAAEVNGPTAAGSGSQAVSAAVTGGGNAELLYVYTSLRCGRMEAAMAALRRHGGGIGGGGVDKMGLETVHRHSGSGDGGSSGGGSGLRGRGWRRRQVQRAVCSAVFAVVSLTGSNQPLARVLKVASVLLLLNPKSGDGY